MQELLKILLVVIISLIIILFITHLELVTEYNFETNDSSEVELFNKEYKVYLSLEYWRKDSLLVGFTTVRKDSPIKINNISCEINKKQFLYLSFDNHYLIEVETSSFSDLADEYKVLKSTDRIFTYNFLFNKSVINEEDNELEYDIFVNGKQFKKKLYFEENSNLKLVFEHGDPSILIIYFLLFVAFFLSLPVLSNLMKNSED